ncbi:hypothetical protein [uncultured Pseudomonas sp.]|uniref:hypothetical protein n=1 Tax=uncultured Pseudomonas sp. TaxID=114707 RepID=UPI00258671F5|nr:hypothetical protein [uncultured Pseudomonas sp.]
MRLFKRQKKGQFWCCFCGAPLVCRTSWFAHVFLRQQVFQCHFAPCSASFYAHTELTHLASPSGLPNAPACELPPSTSHLNAMARKVYENNKAIHEEQLNLLQEEPEEDQQHVREDIAS